VLTDLGNFIWNDLTEEFGYDSSFLLTAEEYDYTEAAAYEIPEIYA
jgi:hypothetical protein